MVRLVTGSLKELAQYVREEIPRVTHTGSELRHSPPKTRSPHEAYVLGYNKACEDVASLLEKVEIQK